MVSRTFFTTTDLIIFVATATFSVAIGIFFAIKDRKKKNTESYFFGDRQMPFVPVGLSLAVSFVSGITIMSYPIEIYYYGGVWLWLLGAFPVSIALACLYIVPVFYNLKLQSVYEYLELRFDKSTRLLSSSLTILYSVNYAAVAIFVPALVLSSWTNIPLHWNIFGTGVLSTFYTIVGGYKSVVWTDAFQSSIMLLGSLFITVKVTTEVGGVSELYAAAERGNRTNWWVFDMDPTTRNTSLTTWFSYSLEWFIILASNQAEIQRYLSCKSERSAKYALWVACIPQLTITSVAFLSGFAAYAYFEGCDPIKTGEIENVNQIIPLLVAKVSENLPGINGLFVSAIYCGTLSTVSSGINSSAVIILNDFVDNKWPIQSERKRVLASKIIGLLIGVSIIAISLVVSKADSTVTRLSSTILSSFGPPILGMFTLGLFLPWSNTKGAIAGALTGFLSVATMAIGSLFHNNFNQKLATSADQCFDGHFVNNTTAINTADVIVNKTIFDISFLHLRPISFFITVSLGLLVSFITGPNDPTKMNPIYFMPAISSKRFSKKFIKMMRFGVPTIEEYKMMNEKMDPANEKMVKS